MELGILLFLLSTSAVQICVAVNVAGCPRDLPYTTEMKKTSDLCYQFVSQEKFWSEARDYCLQYGGRLVKLDNAEKNSFIINTLNSLWWRNNGVWIGLNDMSREMQFRWTGYKSYESEPIGAWSNWGQGHPGAFLHSFRDCVRMVREGGQWKWHETPCNTLRWHYRFICEYKAVFEAVATNLALTQDRKQLQDAQPSPATTTTLATTTTTTTTVATTVEPTTLKETELQLEEEYVILEHLKENEWIENYDTTDEPQTTNFDELTTFENDPRIAEKQLLFEDIGEEDKPGINVKLTLIVVFSLVFIIIAMTVALYLNRRRMTQMKLNAGDTDSTEGIKKKLESTGKLESQISPTVVPNIYVISAQRVLTCAESGNIFGEGPPMMSEADHTLAAEHSGIMGYDVPKQLHLYDEIPAEDHVYETLEEVTAKVTQ